MSFDDFADASPETRAAYRAIGRELANLADVLPGGVPERFRVRVLRTLDEQRSRAPAPPRRPTVIWALAAAAAVVLVLGALAVRSATDDAATPGVTPIAPAAGSRGIDDLYALAIAQARGELAAHQLDRAETTARRALQHLAAAPDVAARVRWRDAYEVMFVSSARRGRDDQALAVLTAWRRAVHDTTRRSWSLDGDLMPAGVDLWALVVAGDHLWTLSANDGSVRIADVGPRGALAERLQRFAADPNDRALSRELGRLLLPSELVAPRARTLHVLLDDELASLPVAALRRVDEPLIASRPIVRALSVPTTTCTPGFRRQRPKSTEPTLRSSEPSLETFGADEVRFARTPTRPRAGVAGCFELGTITRLLAGGWDHVVGSLRACPDPQVAEILATLATDDRGDAVRTLARIQTEQAKRNVPGWANVAVFGNDVCRP